MSDQPSRFRSAMLKDPKGGFSYGQSDPVSGADRDKTPPDAMSAITGPHMAPGAVNSSVLALSGNGGSGLGTLTTTDTTSYLTVFSADITIMADRMLVWFPYELTVKHTVAGATYNVAMYLYKGTLASIGSFVSYPHVSYNTPLVTANTVETRAGTGGVDVALVSAAGPHVIYLTVKNNTAGTLVAGNGNSVYDFIGMYQFGY